MEKTATRILKADEVKLQGQYHLDLGQSPQAVTGVKKPVSAAAQVRIVENNADYAVVEVICKCGTKTQIRCDYRETETE